MTDIVPQLRHCDCSVHCKSGCIQEKAAAEIEQLRADNRALNHALDALEAKLRQD